MRMWNPFRNRVQEGWRKPDVAPRPHWVTFVANLGTIFAIIVAARSLSISQQSMKVGQRAYVAIQNGTAFIRDAFAFERRDDRPLTPFEEERVANAYTATWVTLTFDVRNLGNTPASSLLLSLKYEFPPGWTLSPTVQIQGLERFEENVAQGITKYRFGDVGQKSTMPVFCFRAFMPRLMLHKHIKNTPSYDTKLVVKGTLQYKDVFGDSHAADWSWDIRERFIDPAEVQRELKDLERATKERTNR